MDLRKLKTLIDLVSDSNVSELEITEAEGKVRIVKGPVGGPVQQHYMPAPQAMVPAAAAVAAAEAAPQAPPASTEHVVKSPMVGTFYRSGRRDCSSRTNFIRLCRRTPVSFSNRWNGISLSKIACLSLSVSVFGFWERFAM